ncbi:MAG: DUF4331 domain-containing protein [Chloroflexi bacterium]|nr:DUF4331 domain-containing protein [Chloroflexota bacterium]
MSSHREAPEISKDPVADSTDLYAFVSPDRPDTVTLIANYVPLETPAGGPNFFEFGNEDVEYDIHVVSGANDKSEVIYRFRFRTEVTNPNTFLYNTGPITSLDDKNWNRRQFYTLSRVADGRDQVLADNLASPPCNIGPRSTPNYAALAQAAIHDLPGGGRVFAGQRREGFYVDLGSIFDLGALRPIQNLHLIPMSPMMGIDATKELNVHSMALQLPKSALTPDGSAPTDSSSSKSVIGVYASAARRKAQIRDTDSDTLSGPWTQVSRLGNPLFNEVIVPMTRKDQWNKLPPTADSQFLPLVQQPELAKLLPVLYPNQFPHLAAYTKARADLVAILLTGIPNGVVSGFAGNFTSSTAQDLLRLNMAIPPARSPNVLGLLGGDVAGYPNGRRVADDVVTIELKAIAGAALPLIDPSFSPDAAVGAVTQGVNPDPSGDRYLPTFPYLGLPKDGFHTPAA